MGSGSISPDQRHRTRFPLGAGLVSPRVPVKEALRAKRPGAPDPPSGSRTPAYYPDPSAGRKQAPHPGGPEPPRVRRWRHARAAVTLPQKARPPTAFNAVNEGALYCRARGDFCQAVLLTAHYQGAQCSCWCHPRRTRQSATPARHDSSTTEYRNSYEVDP